MLDKKLGKNKAFIKNDHLNSIHIKLHWSDLQDFDNIPLLSEFIIIEFNRSLRYFPMYKIFGKSLLYLYLNGPMGSIRRQSSSVSSNSKIAKSSRMC